MGVVTSGAVIPVGLMMTWTKLSKLGAIAGVWLGLALGLVGWLVTAYKLGGGKPVLFKLSRIPFDLTDTSCAH